MIESISDMLAAFGYFGASLALLLAISQRLKGNDAFDPTVFYTVVCVAIWQTGLVYIHAGYAFSNPILLQLTIPALAASGPLIYVFFAQMGSMESSLADASGTLNSQSAWVHFILPWLLLVGVFVFPFDKSLGDDLLVFATLVLAAYCSAAAIHLRQLWCVDTLQERSNRHLWCLICLALTAVALDLVSQGLDIPLLGQFSDGTVTLVIIYMFLLQQSYPELHADIEQQSIMQQERYSHLKSLNLEETQKALESLMVKEQLYLDESLKMTQLADKAGLTSHQLSQFLNQHLKMNFSRFVNSYRINEAKKMLKNEPEISILSIGLSVGFSNSSSFHTAFKKETGLTPGKFRQG